MIWKLFKLVYGSIPSFIKALMKHPVIFIKESRESRRRAHELLPATNKLSYDIPVFEEGMPHSQSRDIYCRPTYFCQSDAPEIIAMANKLGAFQKSDREYAEACFEFVKKNIDFTFLQPLGGAVKTLSVGRGICMDNVNLFMALCRAGNIPARYRIYNEAFVSSTYDLFTSGSPIVKDWYNDSGYFIMHTSCEVLIDKEWLVGEFVLPPELEAGLGLPLSRLGDDASGAWCYRIRESTVRFESLPRVVAMGVSLSIRLMSGLFMGIQLRVLDKIEEGRKILEEIGEDEYSRRVKETYTVVLPDVSAKLYKSMEMVQEK